MKEIIVVLLVLFFGAIGNVFATPIRPTPYYLADRVINNSDFAKLAGWGVNTAVVDFDVNGSPSTWHAVFTSAAAKKINLVIWPSDWDDPRPNCGWEAPYPVSATGDINKVKPLLDVASQYSNFIGIVNAHESFWTCDMSFNEMAGLKDKLKAYALSKGRSIKVWNYIDNLYSASMLPDNQVERIMDVAVTWQHCAGNVEGTCNTASSSSALNMILSDRNRISNSGAQVELVFLMQTFTTDGYSTKFTLNQLQDYSCQFLNTSALDGFGFYTWHAGWWPDLHSWPELQPAVQYVYNSCVKAEEVPIDSTPAPFTFTDRTNVALSTVITSNAVTVSGINTAAAISITGGEYSVNGGTYTSSGSTVNNGNTVTVRLTSSGTNSSTTNATLTIGGVSDTFSVTTLPLPGPDTTPNPFTFTDQTSVALSTVITSNTVTVSGINTAADISIIGGEYKINNGLYTSSSGTVNNGNTVTMRQTSSGTNSSTTNATLTIGGVSDTFSVTTQAEQDTTPAPFTFTDQTNVQLSTAITSNTITISGINTAAPISITGGTYSINGGSYTSSSGTVNNGNTLTVRETSSENYSTKTDAMINIGGISDTFSLITRANPMDSPPDPFTFTDQTDAALSTVTTSNTITVTGITSTTPIAITGGEYSINGGPYTSADGMVNPDDTVTVQQTSSGSHSTTTDATLTIGGISDTFSVTTISGSSDGGAASSGGGCFIATAAFDSPLAGQVEILRQFRDRYMLTNDLGRKFVSWYYRNGPVAAQYIKSKPLLKAAVRLALYPLIGFSLLLINGMLPYLLLTIAGFIIFFRFRTKKLSAT